MMIKKYSVATKREFHRRFRPRQLRDQARGDFRLILKLFRNIVEKSMN